MSIHFAPNSKFHMSEFETPSRDASPYPISSFMTRRSRVSIRCARIADRFRSGFRFPFVRCATETRARARTNERTNERTAFSSSSHRIARANGRVGSIFGSSNNETRIQIGRSIVSSRRRERTAALVSTTRRTDGRTDDRRFCDARWRFGEVVNGNRRQRCVASTPTERRAGSDGRRER